MPSEVTQLDVQALKQHLDGGGPLTLLDVREDDERAYAAIAAPAGAIDLHVPMGEITGRRAEILEAAQGRLLVVYCHHGQRSMVVATWLARQGAMDVANLEGGIDAWSKRIDPSIRCY